MSSPRAITAHRALFAWDFTTGVVCLCIVIPATIFAITVDAKLGLTIMLGALPVVATGIAPSRSRRWHVIVIGALMGLGMWAGALIKSTGDVGVTALIMAAIALVTSLAASKWKVALPVLLTVVPIIGIGLTYDDPAMTAAATALLVAGSAIGWLISLLAPDKPTPAIPAAGPGSGLMPRSLALDYGIRLAIALAIGVLVGFGKDHTGWIVGTIGLVMRPNYEIQVNRSLWRVGSVLLGGIAACALAASTGQIAPIAIASALALTVGAAMHASRAYIRPAFMTFVVFNYLLYPHTPSASTHWLVERVVWVTTGVAIAAVMGGVLPWVRQRFGPHRSHRLVRSSGR